LTFFKRPDLDYPHLERAWNIADPGRVAALE
jgi:hypothetical protein